MSASRDCWGDGIYLGRGKTVVTNEDIDIAEETAHNTRGQGISIIPGRGSAVVRAVLSDPAGPPPSAGLDIEPDAPDEPIEDVEILDLTTRNNRGPGLLIALGGHRPRNRSTVVVYQHTDSGSARPLQLYAMS